jgi:hypothetical protein
MMHLQPLTVRPLLGIISLAILLPQTSVAAAFAVFMGVPGIPITVEPDTYYSGIYNGGTWDGISTIFHAPVTVPDGTFSMKSRIYGRNYDSDPAKDGTWGLLNRQTLTQLDDPPWLVKHGLAPEFVGSTQSFSVIDGKNTASDASYIAFEVSLDANVNNEKVLFDDLNLSITGIFNSAGDTEIWATTNQNNFTNPVKADISLAPNEDTDVYTFNFGSTNIVDQKLEVRVYGILGLDQGTFGTTVLSGNVSPAPLPEPTASGLIILGTVGLGAGLRRRYAKH